MNDGTPPQLLIDHINARRLGFSNVVDYYDAPLAITAPLLALLDIEAEYHAWKKQPARKAP